uniref:Uncharacterized protein n=1 Tax=Cacopsylla melanoneura TaxID=428564 RepID=A0A8D9BPS3_9HEMI
MARSISAPPLVTSSFSICIRIARPPPPSLSSSSTTFPPNRSRIREPPIGPRLLLLELSIGPIRSLMLSLSPRRSRMDGFEGGFSRLVAESCFLCWRVLILTSLMRFKMAES